MVHTISFPRCLMASSSQVMSLQTERDRSTSMELFGSCEVWRCAEVVLRNALFHGARATLVYTHVIVWQLFLALKIGHQIGKGYLMLLGFINLFRSSSPGRIIFTNMYMPTCSGWILEIVRSFKKN